MANEYPDNKPRGLVPIAAMGALLLAFALFMLIPLTQSTGQTKDEEQLEMREVKMSPPPPPPEQPPEPEPEPPEPEPPETPPEELNPDINPLDITMSAGTGDAVSMGQPQPTVKESSDPMNKVEDLFSFEDLPQAPRVLHVPRIDYPKSLVNRGIKRGRVVVIIRINEQGKARVERVVSSEHPELKSVARDLVKKARFTKPRIDGRAVKVRGEWPVVLEAP